MTWSAKTTVKTVETFEGNPETFITLEADAHDYDLVPQDLVDLGPGQEQRKQSHVTSNTEGVVTKVQVKLTLETDPGLRPGDQVYVNGHFSAAPAAPPAPPVDDAKQMAAPPVDDAGSTDTTTVTGGDVGSLDAVVTGDVPQDGPVTVGPADGAIDMTTTPPKRYDATTGTWSDLPAAADTPQSPIAPPAEPTPGV